MRETKRIVIAEEMAIFRAASRMLLSSNPTCEAVGEACDGPEAIRPAGSHKLDLIRMEPSTARRNRISAMQEIKKQSPATKILILTVYKAEEHVLTA